MPFTPYHVGPATWMGIGFRKIFHIPALIVGSVIVDIEPFIVLVFKLDFPLHGFFHSLIGGFLAVLPISLVLWLVRKPLDGLMTHLKLKQKQGFWFILWSAMFGVATHVFMDSLFHPDMQPFFPLRVNPFYGHISSRAIHFFCIASFVAGGVIYVVKLILEEKKDSSKKVTKS